MRVGFIGLGQMGRHMSRNLLAKGFEVTVYDIRPEAVAELVAAGARGGENPAEVARQSDVTILMVLNGAQADAVVEGEQGYAAGAGAGDTLVVMSSLPPQVVRKVAESLAAKGVDLIDSPVSGGVEGARAGTLTLMAAGAGQVLERCRPVLEGMGKRIYHVGDQVGQGQITKALNQAMYFAGLAVAAEAVTTGAKAGIDPDVLVEVISHSSGDNWALRNRVPLAWRNNYESGGSLAIALKDLRTATEVAQELDVPLFMTPATLQLFKLAEILCGAGGDDPLPVKAMEILAKHQVQGQRR